MNTYKKLIPIKKVLPSVIGNERADNYLKGLNFVYLGSQDIYEKSLAALMNGETENSLKLIIFGLDYERGYTPLLNLCRTMLFGMSDILKDGDFDTYRHKYKDFKSGKLSLMKKVDELYTKKEELQAKIEELEQKIDDTKPKFFSIKRLYFIYKLVLRKLQPSIDEYNFEIENCDSVIEQLQQEISNLERLQSLEEYITIIKLIVEVCTVPVRYEWAIA